ncbi:MAG: 4-hydroxy-tetrahydrodipicolinate synthase [Clostridiales Family XIII bacterium]|jgi:4-hydroxy-tetrahydrodipicolinate synthase|nr:4-hydroxy-tetrahydrodipicolinate synthase [Clostridiales Family XIII bacterium]
MSIFRGSGVAIVTPFKDGQVDYDALGKLLDWQVAESTDAIIITGTTGEASTLSDEEQVDVIRYAVDKIAGRIPVLAGVGSNETAHAVYLSNQAEKAGVDGLLHVTPYYNKTSRKGLINHYKVISGSVGVPIILYSVAGRTGLNIAPDICEELAEDSRIIGIKEASGNISQVAEIARVTRGKNFDIWSGNDDQTLPLLALGGAGVISTVANIVPKDVHDMVYDFFNGDVEKATTKQLDLKPLIDAVFIEVNPIPIKAALYLLGRIAYEYREPLVQLEDSNFEKLRNEMQRYGLL